MCPPPDPEDFSNLRLDNQLCFALYAATHSITRAYRPLLSELGLTYPQYLVLLVLWENNSLPVGTIAKRLQLDAAALTPLVKRLEALDLVFRERDQRDERIVRITLTEKALALRMQVSTIQHELSCRTRLSQIEVGDLRQQLQGLVKSLNEEESSEA